MSFSFLADEAPSSAWAHHPWPWFSSLSAAETTAILPLFGFANHGLSLPLDIEEVVGSHLLKGALESFASHGFLTLPPLRFGLAPYPQTLFGLDPDHAHTQLRELALSVKASGVRRLVFFSTSPWNEEWIDAASRDLRQELGLRTFVINLAGLGLDFHPTSTDRRAAFYAAAATLGHLPTPSSGAGSVFDADFRPGNFQVPPGLPPGPALDGSVLLSSARARLVSLLEEISGRTFPELPAATPPAKRAEPKLSAPRPFPADYRPRYLAALTWEELTSLREREKAIVLIPTGAIEQHGHHLPVGVDSLLGQAYLKKAAALLGAEDRVWITPPVTFGKSNEHSGFPGTLSVSAASLRQVVTTLVCTLHGLGFRQFALLNTHGGNSAVLVYTLRELQTRLGCRLGMLNRLYKPELSAQEAEYGFHAGEWETSLMLAIAPELVDMSRACVEYPARIDDPGLLRPENAPAIYSWITSDVSRSGTMGNAPAATAAKGMYWWDNYASSIVRRLAGIGGGA